VTRAGRDGLVAAPCARGRLLHCPGQGVPCLRNPAAGISQRSGSAGGELLFAGRGPSLPRLLRAAGRRRPTAGRGRSPGTARRPHGCPLSHRGHRAGRPCCGAGVRVRALRDEPTAGCSPCPAQPRHAACTLPARCLHSAEPPATDPAHQGQQGRELRGLRSSLGPAHLHRDSLSSPPSRQQLGEGRGSNSVGCLGAFCPLKMSTNS